MRSSIRLFRIAGIDIGIHYTWIFIFVLIAWSLAQGFFPQAYPGWSTTTYWVTGFVASLLLFVSVLLHELAHSLVARARGLPVRSITLFIFGGVSNLEEEPQQPRVEFFMSIVGPLTSLVLAGICWGIFQLVEGQSTPAAATLFYLALINALLAGFNLLPAFPLDGGRVLRSILWGTTGSLTKATNIAAISGRVFSWLFIGYGVYQLLWVGNLFGGLWIAFIGWFLGNAADTSRREVGLRERLTGVRVQDVMDSNPVAVSPATSVWDLVRDTFRQYRRRAVPVSQGNQAVGIITFTDVRELPQDRWAQTPVEEIMTRTPLYSVAPEDDLSAAMKLIAQHDINQVLVLKQGQLVGLLSRADIIQYLQLSQELGVKFDTFK